MSNADGKKVVAAVDSSLAGNPVLVTARALARVLGARVEAVHVLLEDESAPHHAAQAAGVPLRVMDGPVVDRLVDAGRAADTTALVIGARSTPTSPRALGSTALAVVTSSTRPVVVVPPVGRIAPILRRVLVPVEHSVSASLAPRSSVELGSGTSVDIVVLSVDEDPPSGHEEFLRRFCPWGIGLVEIERRSGRREELVPLVADELACDLIALGWAQELEPGRSPIVRAALERSPLPIMLIPVSLETDGRATLAASARRGEERDDGTW
jgi:nucleotide-binding universal stress UspA family protein